MLLQSPSTLILTLLLLTLSTPKLLHVAVLFRHGARYPINPYYDYLETIGDAGELTPVGFRQLFNLGRYLRRDYVDKEGLFAGRYDHSEVRVFSTEYRRTVESAKAFMMGVFPEGTGPQIPENVQQWSINPLYENSTVFPVPNPPDGLPQAFQPIPIHNGQEYLQNCDNYKAWQDLMIAQNFQNYASITTHYSPLIQKLRQLFKLKDSQSNLVGLSHLYDTLLCDRYLGKPLPAGLNESEFDNLRHLHYYLFMLIHSGTYSRIISTPLFERIVGNFDLVLEGKVVGGVPKKMTVFSGHDVNISPTLSFLNFSSFECIEDLWRNRPLDKYLNCEDGPAFAANIIIELWDGSSDDKGPTDPYIKVLYNGKYLNLCNRPTKTCSYSQWRSSVSAQFINYKSLCSLSQPAINKLSQS